MDCEERDRLLEAFNAATVEYVRQEERTKAVHANSSEWAVDHAKLQVLEKELDRARRAVLEHRDEHGC